MKTKLLISTILIFATINSNAQAPAVEWQKCYGGTVSETGNCIRKTADGGCVMIGFTNSTDGDVTSNHGTSDYWVVKINAVGVIEWQKSYGGIAYDEGSAIEPTSDGGYIMIGSSVANSGDGSGGHGGFDCWVVKINSTGIIQWQKALGGTGDENGKYIRQTADGGYILTARVNINNGDVTGTNGSTDLWAVKLDPIGEIVWTKALGGSGEEGGYSEVQTTTDGGFILASISNSTSGDVTGNHGSFDCWLVKLSASGVIQWQKSYGGSGYDRVEDIKQTSDGGFIFCGSSDSTNGDVTNNVGDNSWVVKTNATGTIEWQKVFGTASEEEFATGIQLTIDGNYVLSGYSFSPVNFDIDYWIIKISASGLLLWQKTLGGSEYDFAEDIQQTADGGYFVFGNSRSIDGDITSNHGLADYWLLKLAPEQLNLIDFQNDAFSLYPNPNNGNFTIDFDIADLFGDKEIQVFNILGQRVYNSKVNTEQVVINLSSKPKGIYICKVLIANKVIKTGKIIME